MIIKGEDAEKRTALKVAELMLTAAKTAPKGCGVDNVEAVILEGKDKDNLAEAMRKIAKDTNTDFFERDAGNVDNSHCVVIVGVKANPLGLENCKFCGFENCSIMLSHNGNCAFNITDLGIAIGSAVSVAADNRVDNRVLFSAGKAALAIGCLHPSVKVCYGIPLSTASKNIMFDRADQAIPE